MIYMLHAHVSHIKAGMGVNLNVATGVVQSLVSEVLSSQVAETSNVWVLEYMQEHQMAGQVVCTVGENIRRALQLRPEIQQKLGRIRPEEYVFQNGGMVLCLPRF